MKIKKGYSFKVVAGENIVVPLADESLKTQGIFKLNPQAAKLFELFLNGAEISDAVKLLTETYGISEYQAQADASEFVELLKSYNMIDD